jgi:DNA-damage-inducible protein J
MKTAAINARIAPDLKEDVESILARLGVTTTQAITMYFEQIRMNKGLPFSVRIPNDETLRAIREAEAGELVELDLEELRKDMVD